MKSKDAIIEELRELVEKLSTEIAELKLQLAKANKDSSNSSKSPSSDITNAGKGKKKKNQADLANAKLADSPDASENCETPCRQSELTRSSNTKLMTPKSLGDS